MSVVTADAELARRIKSALELSARYGAEVVVRSLAEFDAEKLRAGHAALQIVEASPDSPAELAALERHVKAFPTVRIIVISRVLAQNGARQFLKLGIADWLPSSCSAAELLAACDHALKPRTAHSAAAAQARCIGFMSAIGGAGATTLCLASALALARKSGRGVLRRACVVDLDFQHGTLAEYADVAPALQLEEIGKRPERLDQHLLEIMLTRHASGLAVLSAPAMLTGPNAVKPEVVGRLLDLAAAEFEHLAIDLPCCWQSWCENVIRALDVFYIVTGATVAGLRQARHLAQLVHEHCGIDVNASVIVNKSRRFRARVTRSQACEALGPLLAGFISDGGDALGRAQDRGAMLTTLGPRARITLELIALLAARAERAANTKTTDRKARS